MSGVYLLIVRNTGTCVIGLAALLFAVWAVPSLLVFQISPLHIGIGPKPWDQSMEWAALVLQMGVLAVLVLGGVVPISQWWTESVPRVKADKPLVFTNRLADGGLEVSNIGAASAVNVWLVIEDRTDPIPLGALDPHSSRPLPPEASELLHRSTSGRHMLLAEARPHTQRPFTPTFNVRIGQPTRRAAP